MPDLPELALLTATEAAAILKVDVKTFRRLKVPFVLAGKSRRYTTTILQDWILRSTTQWRATPARGKRKAAPIPANSTSRGAKARPTGKLPSESTVIEFARVVGQRTA